MSRAKGKVKGVMETAGLLEGVCGGSSQCTDTYNRLGRETPAPNSHCSQALVF